MRWASILGLLAAQAQAATLASEQHYAAESVRGAMVAQAQTARVTGMGGAFTAVGGDIGNIAVNPGGVGQILSTAGEAMYGLMGNEAGISVLAGALPVGWGTVGVHVAAMSFGSYDLRDAAGAKTGSASAMDLGVTAAVGVRNPAWFLGAGSSGLSVEAVSEAAGGLSLGLGAGVVVPVNDRLTAGLAVQHLGPARGGAALPRTLRAGAAYVLLDGALRPAVDAGYGFVERTGFVAVGAEYAPIPMATVRAGYRMDPSIRELNGLSGVTAGLGVRYRSFGLDYAFQPFGDLATVHRVALVYAPPQAPAAHPAPATVAAPAASAPTAESEYRAAAAAYAAGDAATGWARAYAALQLDPAHWQAWQMLGNCQYAKGDKEGALTSYRRSLELHPDNPQLKTWLDQAK